MIQLLLAVATFLPALQTPVPAPTPPPRADPDKVHWLEPGLDVALADAKARTKLVLAWFRMDGNEACSRMTLESFSNDQVADALKDVLCVRVDVGKQHDLADRYRVKDPPVVLWFNSDGSVRDRINGYETTDAFLANATRIQYDLGTINAVRRRVAAKADDLDARLELYTRLKESGDTPGSDEQKAAISKLDPQGVSRASHHLQYERITSEIEQYWAQTGTLDMKRIDDLQTFVELEADPELVWDGWIRLANTHAYLAELSTTGGKFADAKEHRATRRRDLSLAWRAISADRDLVHAWGFSDAALFWDQRDELSPADKEFLLTLTGRLVQVFDAEPQAYDLRARALGIAGKLSDAIEAEKKALELEPANKTFQDRLKQLGG
jgi:tetratricopeptide (TPR) repeat protein